MKKPVLGILGGMGTQATAKFYEILHKLQRVDTEQGYLDV
jgi:aspartate/glutamate racemase